MVLPIAVGPSPRAFIWTPALTLNRRSRTYRKPLILHVRMCEPIPEKRVNTGPQLSNLISFGTGEVRISWHNNIVFLCDNKRISNPPTMLHLAPEFTLTRSLIASLGGTDTNMWA